MPSGPVDDEYSVSAWCHQGRDFIKMPLHGLSVAAGQDKARTDTARGTDGTEDIGRLRALVPERRGSAAASRPAPGEHGFLADPGLILPPNFYRGVGREPGSDLPQPGGEVFLKSSTANSFCPLWRGRADILRNPSALNSRAHRRLINRNAELFEYPMRQVLSAPTHDTVDRRNRSALNKPSERLSLPVIELGRLACRLAVNQTIRPLGVETENPVTDHLEPDSTDPRRLRATATIVNLSQRKKRRLCPASFDALANRRSAGPSNLPVTQPLCPWRTSVSVRLIDSDFLPFGNPLNESPSMLDGISPHFPDRR